VTLKNSTVTSNNATNEGIPSTSHGGGIYNTGTVMLKDSTVTSNTTSGSGGGIYSEPGGAVTVNDSTITGNTPDNCDGVSC
jgi:hypothetical protein